MTPKQIMNSFHLEGKISQQHAKEIETTLTEALVEEIIMKKYIVESWVQERWKAISLEQAKQKKEELEKEPCGPYDNIRKDIVIIEVEITEKKL